MIILKQMIILFVLMLIGLICRKRGIMTDEGSRVISGIVVNVANPALIISASINKESVIKGSDLIFIAILSVTMYIILVLFSKLLVKLLRLPDQEQNMYCVMTVFSNIGFMGFPLIMAAYGSDALLYASFFIIPYNVLIYTWGIAAMKTNEESEKETKKIAWNRVFNIGVIACIITIVIYLTQIKVPVMIESIVTYLSGLTAPLSMLVIGDSISKMDLKKLFLEKKLLLFSIVKQLVIPLLGVWVLSLLGIDLMMKSVCMVMLATPVGSMTAMLAQQYDGDYELASKGVALTTILSVATMPIVAMLTGL